MNERGCSAQCIQQSARWSCAVSRCTHGRRALLCLLCSLPRSLRCYSLFFLAMLRNIPSSSRLFFESALILLFLGRFWSLSLLQTVSFPLKRGFLSRGEQREWSCYLCCWWLRVIPVDARDVFFFVFFYSVYSLKAYFHKALRSFEVEKVVTAWRWPYLFVLL